jgi:hypothetical protein
MMTSTAMDDGSDKTSGVVASAPSFASNPLFVVLSRFSRDSSRRCRRRRRPTTARWQLIFHVRDDDDGDYV